MTTPVDNKLSFTYCLKRLEEIAQKLEDPDIDIEEALKLLEEGMKLHKFCSDKLTTYQTKIKEILREDTKQPVTVSAAKTNSSQPSEISF